MNPFRTSHKTQRIRYQNPYLSEQTSGVCLQNTYDYSPFGVSLDGRTVEGDFYRRGFNGMEKDDEFKGKGNSYEFGARMFDNRVGRFFSKDPKFKDFPFYSVYHFASNNPILYRDLEGKEGDPTLTLYYGFQIGIKLSLQSGRFSTNQIHWRVGAYFDLNFEPPMAMQMGSNFSVNANMDFSFKYPYILNHYAEIKTSNLIKFNSRDNFYETSISKSLILKDSEHIFESAEMEVGKITKNNEYNSLNILSLGKSQINQQLNCLARKEESTESGDVDFYQKLTNSIKALSQNNKNQIKSLIPISRENNFSVQNSIKLNSLNSQIKISKTIELKPANLENPYQRKRNSSNDFYKTK
jgi:RHS repeat-associated protein